MKPHDPMLWAEQEREIKEDSAIGEKFLEFLYFWADAAERMMAEELAEPAQALRRAFTLAEEQLGQWDLTMAGQMLAIMALHWAWRDEMWDGLTIFERLLCQEVVVKKLDILAEEAASE